MILTANEVFIIFCAIIIIGFSIYLKKSIDEYLLEIRKNKKKKK